MTTHRVLALCAAALAIAGCSTNSADSSPETVTVTETPSSTAGDPPASECSANAESTPVPSVEMFGTVPDYARISLSINGLLSGSITPGAAPAEVDVTMCNDSPVDYPSVGVLLVLTNCSCADNPMGFPTGTIDRFDAATRTWVALPQPVVGGGMDYLGTFTDVQPLPKGASVTVKYRVALDASMTEGDGGLEAAAVVPDPLFEIGGDEMQFAAVP